VTARTLDFYFDFISPFGYLASLRVDALADKRRIECKWHSMLLGISVLKVMGMKPLPSYPLKGPYLQHDLQRAARRQGVVLNRAAAQANPVPAGRCFHWLKTRDEGLAKSFANAALHAYWRKGEDIGRPETVSAIAAAAAGLQAHEILFHITEGEGDRALRSAVDLSLQKGVFGSPFFIVDGEPFFGLEKMELLDEWLAAGGW
jgi:2-hydroxychromene-2-carboxylate isomerase